MTYVHSSHIHKTLFLTEKHLAIKPLFGLGTSEN